MKRALVLLLTMVMCLCLVFTGCGGKETAASAAATAAAQTSAAATAEGTATSVAPAQSTSDDTVYTLIYATPNGPTVRIYNEVEEPLLKAIEAASNGRIKFEEYTSGSLVSTGDGVDSLKSGICDVCFDVASYYSGVFPLTVLLEQGIGMSAAQAMSWVYYDLIHSYDGITEYDDIVVLEPISQGPKVLLSSKPVRSLADMKGTSIRSNSTMSPMVQAWGGNPVTLGISEVYEAFQNHLIDGGIFSYESMGTGKYYEVCDYLIDMPMTQTSIMLNMSKGKYDSLPDDLRAIITDTAYDCFVSTGSQYYTKLTQTAVDEAKADNSKVEWIHMDDATIAEFNKLIEPLTQNYLTTLDGMGYDGQAALDWVTQEYQKYIELYPEPTYSS